MLTKYGQATNTMTEKSASVKHLTEMVDGVGHNLSKVERRAYERELVSAKATVEKWRPALAHWEEKVERATLSTQKMTASGNTLHLCCLLPTRLT
jgi:hypothetical protein